MSFLPVFGLENTFTNTDSNDILPNISGNPIPTLNTIKLSGSANYAYGLNATASVNRTVEIESYGVVSIIDSIEVDVIGNETKITHFNYTLPNINTDKIAFISFRIANNSLEDVGLANATRYYTINRLINYTTYVVPFFENKTSINQGEKYFVSVYTEYARPFTYSMLDNEQLLHYNESLYPFINNIPLENCTVTVNKQGNDNFVDNAEYPVTPTNDTAGIIYITKPEQDQIKWSNITRNPFNYSQSYEDDVIMNIYVQSVSTAAAVDEATNTILFKASEIYRKIEIDPFGLARVTEEQTIVFLGPERPENLPLTSIKLYALNALSFILPPNSTVISLDDEIGGLNIVYQLNQDGFFERGAYNLHDTVFPDHPGLVIFPRSPLFHGDETKFTIVYQVPLEVFLSKEQGTINYKLKLTPSAIINWTIDNLYLDIVLPKGAVYNSFTYAGSDPYQEFAIGYDKVFDFSSLGFKRILHLATSEFSGSDNAPLTVYFTYSRVNLWITYFLQVITVGIIFAIYLGIRWSSKAAKEIVSEEEIEFIPVEEIEDFVKQYEEILALRDRLRETAAKIASKKLKAREGKDLQTKLQKRLRAEEETIKITKENLIKHGGRYKESVQKIEIAERKLYEERRNLRALQQEYRVKKSMTKDSYIKLFRERQQTIEKLKNEIDGILVTLRMLLEP